MEVLIEEANFFYPDGFWLMQDNARSHVSWSTIHFLLEIEISFIEWPSMSPDLNPIENVWALMKHEVEKQLPSSLAEVKLAIPKVWDDLDPDNYINSMQNRIARVFMKIGRRRCTLRQTGFCVNGLLVKWISSIWGGIIVRQEKSCDIRWL